MATSQTGSAADVSTCSDNEIVNVDNQKNEARFSFSQIHFNVVFIQVIFTSMTNWLCERDSSSSGVLMAIFTMLEEVSKI